MNERGVSLVELEKPELEDPVLIEGLPGVGNVGKLAADHLADELDAVAFGEIYSRHFPPQVLVDENGLVRLVKNELRYIKKSEENGLRRDLILLLGDYQGITPEGQYDLTREIIDACGKYGCRTVYTLGGYGLGKIVDKPRVLGAATDDNTVSELKEAGVVFDKGEPGSGIVGASGLLLGLGKLEGWSGACLMGETSGFVVDPTSAKAVLEVLSQVLGFKLAYESLEGKAAEIEKIASHLADSEGITAGGESADDLRYIG